MSKIILLAAAAVAAMAPSSTPVVEPQADPLSTRSIFLTGVNLAGAEFGPPPRPGGPPAKHGVDYVYPSEAYVEGYKSPSYFLAKGMNTFRIAFLWERIQPKLMQGLDHAELARLARTVNTLARRGAWVILDLHNYARYEGKTIGSQDVTLEAFADVWKRLAATFKHNPKVLFGIMNEPYEMPTETWVDAANAALVAIRATRARNIVLVPGNGYTSAGLWASDVYGTPNAMALDKIHDPLQRIVFEAHLYLDHDGSGTNGECPSATLGVERLQPFTDWLKARKQLGFIGEFGAGTSDVCLEALSSLATTMLDNRDVLLGWTYWAAGPWWPVDYFSRIEPGEKSDAPQMRALLPHLGAPQTVGAMAPHLSAPEDATARAVAR